MKGTQIRFIRLCIRLFIISALFCIIPIMLYGLSKHELLFYFIFLSIISISCLGYCYKLLNIRFQNSTVNKRVLKKLKKSHFQKIENYPIYTTENSSGYGALAQELYDSIIEKQKAIFIENGYIIIVGSKKELRCLSRDKFINGYFSKVNKYILLFTDCETSPKKPYNIKTVSISSFRMTFYHEWGHFLDYANSYISETIPFLRNFYSEKQKFKTIVRFSCAGIPSLYFRRFPKIDLYELVNNSEYFAVHYSRYRLNILYNYKLKEIFEDLERV